MNKFSFITFGFLFLFTLLGLFWPLRQFDSQKLKKTFLFHSVWTVLILGEIYFLKYSIFFKLNLDQQVRIPFLILALFCLDLLSYFWHRLNHNIPFLWVLHRFHHRAEVLDPLAAYRFHPLEIFFGFQLRIILVSFLGINSGETAIFIFIFGILNLFQHSNWKLPPVVENTLGFLFVTPSIHHTHHLKDIKAQNSNFSTIFIFWDKLFGTFHRPTPPSPNDLGLSS